MPKNFPIDSFIEAFQEARKYPSKGKRSQYDGLPSRPTLARYSTMEAIDVDPGGGEPLKSANMRVLATVIKLARNSDDSIARIRQASSDKDGLRMRARQAVMDTYPDADDVLPPNTFHSANHTFDTMTAVSAAKYDVDPIQAIRNNLSGDTRYR